MRRIDTAVSRLILTSLALCLTAVAWPAENNEPVRHPPALAADPTDRILVFWNASAAAASKSTQLATLAKESGTAVASTRKLASQIDLVKLSSNSQAATAALLAKLRADPRVRAADYDHRRFAHATTPNDPQYPYVQGVAGQWYLQSLPAQAAAIHADVAWDTTVGHSGIVVADLDTGIRFDHPDLKRAAGAGKLLPGYDFIDAPFAANDGDGRDPDPSDPGDFCNGSTSSWHGTRTAGIIGALTNNNAGVAGINWNAYLLPVRVLGRCGGMDSDIIPAMLWAGGMTIPGLPPNPYPARVINMSLGAAGACDVGLYGPVIAELALRGVVVVASAGNEGGAVGTPANCPGAVAVAGLRHIGTKVGFSNLGPEIAISAPGGNCVNTAQGQPCLFSIDTTTGLGDTVPTGTGYTDQIDFSVGTSFSAPMVSGVASLMMAVDTNLTPAHIVTRLRSGATKPFPVNPVPDPVLGTIQQCRAPGGALQNFECNCTVTTCGAGMLNAQGAVTEALRPIASVALPAPGSISAGSTVNLLGNRSVAACDRTISTYLWSVTAGPGVLSNTDQANTSIPAPPVGMTIQVRLVVTDSQSATDTADIAITSNTASSSVPTITPLASSCPVAINVPQVPAPTVTLSAAPATINAGQTTVLTWSSTNALTCTASGAWQGTRATSGTLTTAALAATSTFTLTCEGAAGNSPPQSAIVTVLAAPTATLSVSPASISSGQSATLTWSSVDATGCTASGAWMGAKAISGTESTGALTSSSTFTIVCDGPTGTSASRSATVTIAVTGNSGGGGGGGGGALGWLSLLALSMLMAISRRPVSA